MAGRFPRASKDSRNRSVSAASSEYGCAVAFMQSLTERSQEVDSSSRSRLCSGVRAAPSSSRISRPGRLRTVSSM
ncbi:hypothetical protein [Paenibacillus sp. P22]|uniref:hypothetical protein n=1 Tax=Paenibacillus sp. P22 TaxID=483908 RepID=UPI001E2A17F1|nr:hypothetical protein [Paenibacillus sp. P22]